MTSSPVTDKRFPLTEAQKAEIYRRLGAIARANRIIENA